MVDMTLGIMYNCLIRVQHTVCVVQNFLASVQLTVWVVPERTFPMDCFKIASLMSCVACIVTNANGIQCEKQSMDKTGYLCSNAVVAEQKNPVTFEDITVVLDEMYEETNKVKYTEYEIPDYDTFFKSYMSYRAITNTSSPQYKLQQQCWTDENGLRRQTDDYVVAVGSYYSKHIGDRFRITLSDDTQFTVIVGDIKADRHTDSKHQYRAVYNENGKFISANVLEFVVDIGRLPSSVRRSGTVSSIEELKGNIKSIEKIEE